MVAVTGPVRVACTPFSAISGEAVTPMLMFTYVAGPSQGQGCAGRDPHAVTDRMDRASIVTNTGRMGGVCHPERRRTEFVGSRPNWSAAGYWEARPSEKERKPMLRSRASTGPTGGRRFRPQMR